MKIVIDDQIPLIEQTLSPFFETTLLPTDAITNQNIKHADILITRSVTPINLKLLADSHIKIVASPSSGHNHIDTAALNAAGITVLSALGCNALSCADYVVACIAGLNRWQLLTEPKLAAIIGVGHVGKVVKQRLSDLGFAVRLYDPPHALRDNNFHSATLQEIFTADLICIHAALTTEADYPSYHLIDQAFLKQLKPQCIIINTARGEIINTNDLLATDLTFCCDVFESEPDINPQIVQQALIATPHIAGHAIEAKWRGTQMIAQQLLNLFDKSADITTSETTQSIVFDCAGLKTWEEIVLQIYDPALESVQLKQPSNSHKLASMFKKIRAQHKRHEFQQIKLTNLNVAASQQKILSQLGFSTS